MAKDVQQLIAVRPDFQIKRGAIKSESGLSVRKVARAIFDFSALDSAGAANSAVGAHGTGIFLPAKAIITRMWYQVQTALTSAASTATIAAKAEAANDLYTATAVSDSTLGTTGFKEGIPDGTAAKFVQCSVERELIISVAVQALTAGRLILHVDYAIGE